MVRPGGIHGDLVRERSERRQQAAAMNHDSDICLADHGQGDVRPVRQRSRAGDSTALHVEQRVRERQIVLAHVLVVAADVVLECRTIPAEIVPRGGHRHQADVQKVRRAPHHAAGRAGPVGHHVATTLQVSRSRWGDERQAHRIATGRGAIGHGLPQGGVVLHVVQRGERVDTVPQRRMGGDVFDSLATEPNFCGLLPQS